MAGIGGIYYVGNAGGYLGSDGLYGTDLMIEVWHGHRMYLEAKYRTYNYRPIGFSLKKFIPYGPNDPDMTRIAMILFASNLFVSCPSFNKVVEECEVIEYIDFDAGYNVPKHFNDLLKESRSIQMPDDFNCYYAKLEEIKI